MLLLSNSKLYASLKILLFILVALTLLSVLYTRKEETYNGKYLGYASELRVLTQQIGKRAGEVSGINEEVVWDELKLRREQFDRIIKILINGEYEQGNLILPPSPSYIQLNSLTKLLIDWEVTKKLVDNILMNKVYIQSSYILKKNAQTLLRKLTDQYSMASEKIEKTEASINTIIAINQQINSLTKFSDDIEKILTLNIIVPELEKELPIKTSQFLKDAENLRMNYPGTEIKGLLEQISGELLTLQQYVDETANVGKVLDSVYASIEKILQDNLILLEDATNLYNNYIADLKNKLITHNTTNLLGGSAIFFLILLGYLLNLQGRLELKETEEKNRKINQDVATLLRELSDLASGNLGITATGSSNITKEIASSINYAVEALRKLVLHINEVTEQASEMTEETQTLMTHLAFSSKKQEKEIIQASNSVQAMTTLAEKVSDHASQSADVAQQSVTIANEGGMQVRKTIDGMVRIQAQMRSTSAKMVRLRDSSNEIGQIISLIDTIADQTNILSLNASIQAAMAGDAGLGFAVVADEIQRLAEKVGLATHEIGSLVRSIQADTLEVIGSMEQTRLEVKDGGALAFNAGKALEKIELVSTSLANHIQSISLSAAKQKNMSSTIAQMMSTIEEISQQIASGSLNTAEFTKKLTILVTKLRNSVSEFKLPSNPYQS